MIIIMAAATAVSSLASFLSIPEPSARFLFGLFIIYPLALVYRPVIATYANKTVQCLICGISGITLLYFVFGISVWHSLFDVITVYFILRTFGGGRLSLCLTWIVTMGHLVSGYVSITMSGQVHPIAWTIPHCVLVLNLIGLAYDLYDGTKPKTQLSDEQKLTAITIVPSFIEYFGYCYLFTKVLTGPPVSFTRYHKFVSGQLFDNKKVPSSVYAGLRRLCLGLFTAGVYSIFNRYFPLSYITSTEYQSHSLVFKLAIMVIIGKLALWRYMTVWIIAESSCVLIGLSYNGQYSEDSDIVDWSGLSNVHFGYSETSVTLQGTIDSFNVLTNKWTAKYIYKRLKWLQNKTLSHIMSLLFLSLWHGVWPGYLICFSLEFLLINCERQFIAFISKWVQLSDYTGLLYALLWICMFIMKQILITYSLLPFMLLSWSACWKFMSSVYWAGHVIALGWLLFRQTVKTH